jgi:hypothetical protein
MHYRNYANLFNHPWRETDLSDCGYLGLVAVPWLLQEVEDHGQHGNANGNPGAQGVRPPQPPVQFVHPEQTKADTATVVVSGNPLAKGFITFLAKLVGVRFHAAQANPLAIQSQPKPEAVAA